MTTKWPKVKLKDTTSFFVDGNWIESKDQSAEGVRLIQTGNIGTGYYKSNDHRSRFVSLKTFDRLNCTEVLPGDVLVSRLPDPIGRACVVPDLGFRTITGVDCSILRFIESVLPEYFVYFSQSSMYLELITSKAGGSTRQRISRSNLGEIEIPLPPLDEQKRIVAKLDEALGDLDQVTENSKSELDQLDSLWGSYLECVFNQNPEPASSNEWAPVRLDELFDIGSSKRVMKSDWSESGVPFYRGREISTLSNFGSIDNDLFISEELYKSYAEKYGIPAPGDLMMTAIGTVGNVWVVETDHRFYFKDASVLWLAKRNDCESGFIKYWMKSKSFFDQLKLGAGATVDSLTIGRLSEVKIPLPPLDEQKRVVAKLDDLKQQIDSLQKAKQDKIEQASSLRSSILSAAFAGDF